MLRISNRAWASAGLIGSILCFAGYFWHIARHNPEINFLTSEAPAEWILYPMVPMGSTHPSIEVNTTFRRSFVLQKIPPAASLKVRAMKRCELTVNGASVLSETVYNSRWKEPRQVDVAAQLRPGTNEIAITVWNTNAPPALWLALQTGDQTLISDTNWKVQILDSVEIPAALATTPPALNPGNRMVMDETPLGGLRAHWVFFICATALSALVFLGLRKLQPRCAGFFARSEFTLCVIALPVLLWAAMYCNNLHALPSTEGFDAIDHLSYIERVQKGPGLPLANEGWQMYQPPLYYMVCAIAEDITGPATQFGKATVARVLGLGIGVAHFTLIFLSLRLIFPRRIGMQCFGLLLAALLPAHLYISQFVTNEALAAMLVTASLYCCLRIIVAKRDSWRSFLAVGIFFGAALLAKVTAVLAAPFIAIALIDPTVFREPARLKNWFINTAGAAAVCVAVCGWHYHRVWSHFGSPLVGNWSTSVWQPWWMEPGFRTWSYFFRFGECLTHPWFSGVNSFADGLYSTLWGDALIGGRIAGEFRPSWNYQLMAAGFLLAIIPSILIFVGALATVKNFSRQPGRVWLVLIGIPLVTLSALVYMNLKVPAYAEVKAFYGLIALLPICVCGALGYEALKRLGKAPFAIAIILLGVWAMNSYAAFWIRPGSADALTHRALEAAHQARGPEAVQLYSEAVRRAPHDVKIKAMMAMDCSFLGNTNEIKTLATSAVKDPLPDTNSHLSLAEILGLDGQREAAVAEARKSLAAGSDNSVLYDALCDWHFEAGRYDEVISTAREGERVSPLSAGLHFKMGQAFAGLGDQTNAANQFHFTSLLRPEWPLVSDELGKSLLALQRYGEATNAFWQALRIVPQEPNYHYHLAVALAGLGDEVGEMAQYREILRSNPKFIPSMESLAWRLATTANPALQDGAEAIQLATTASQQNGVNQSQALATLAAAYARAGEFENATETIRRAITPAEYDSQTDRKEFNQKLLKLFESQQPYIDENPRKPVVPLDADSEKKK